MKNYHRVSALFVTLFALLALMPMIAQPSRWPSPPRQSRTPMTFQATTGYKARADGYFWISDAPGANFDDKFAAAVKANDAAHPDVIFIHIDWTGDSWTMLKPVELKPLHGDQLRVHLLGDDVWRLILYKGPAGTADKRVAIFRLYALKESAVIGVKIWTFASGTVGFDACVDSKLQSNSGTHWLRDRVQFADGTDHSIGFRCGYNPELVGSGDNCNNIYEQCDVSYFSSAQTGENGASGMIVNSAIAGHRGFVFQGYNNLGNTIRETNVVNCIGLTTKGIEGQQPGGSGSMCFMFGSSGAPIVYDLNIGFKLTAFGGRHELGGVLLVQGDPGTGNGNASQVTLNDLTAEEFSPDKVSATLHTRPGALVSCHDGTRLVMSNVILWTVGAEGDPLTSNWLDLDCNLPTQRPVLSFTNVEVRNGAGTAMTYVPFKPKQWTGVWTKVVDGVKTVTASISP